MSDKFKIISLPNAVIDAMDQFAKDQSEEKLGGRHDYWNALETILNASDDAPGGKQSLRLNWAKPRGPI